MKKSISIIVGCVISIFFFQAFSVSNDPEYKNLKILPKNISKHDLDSVMHHFSQSLGVKCNFCHVNNGPKDWDFASDAKPEKNMARKMMQLAIDINKNYFVQMEMDMDMEHGQMDKDHPDSMEHHMDHMDMSKMDTTGMNNTQYMLMSVTCYTCHRGDAHPEKKIPAMKEGQRPPEPQKSVDAK